MFERRFIIGGILRKLVTQKWNGYRELVEKETVKWFNCW